MPFKIFKHLIFFNVLKIKEIHKKKKEKEKKKHLAELTLHMKAGLNLGQNYYT